MIQRPKKVQKAERGYLTNEKYQDYAESQFKTIYDYLDGNEKDVSNILNKIINNIGNMKIYHKDWNTSISFECSIGHHALVLCSHTGFYTLWNAPDEFHTVSLYGSGYTFTRNSNDKTKFTLSANSNNAYTIIVF